VARVLKPGGRLLLHDIMAGAGGPHAYPTPWASRAEDSFLLSPERVRGLLAQSGLTEEAWEDRTESTRATSRKQKAERAAGQAPPPGPYLYLGPDFKTMAANLAVALEEDRLALILGFLRKPS